MSRHVQFVEHIFPFNYFTSDNGVTSEPLFPSPSITHIDTDGPSVVSPSNAIPSSGQSDNTTGVTELIPTEPTLVKSTRVRKLPTKFKDYTCLPTTMITNCISPLSGTTVTYPLHNISHKINSFLHIHNFLWLLLLSPFQTLLNRLPLIQIGFNPWS